MRQVGPWLVCARPHGTTAPAGTAEAFACQLGFDIRYGRRQSSVAVHCQAQSTQPSAVTGVQKKVQCLVCSVYGYMYSLGGTHARVL